MRPSGRLGTGLLVVGLLAPAAAVAFVMSSGQVLHRVARHRAELELSSLVVRGSFTFTGAYAAAAAAALKVPNTGELTSFGTLTYKMPGRCRVELESRGGLPATAVNVNGNVKTSGPALEPLKAFAADVCPLLAQPSSEELVSFLRARDVETAPITLGRANGVVSYVIGGRPKDAGVPSFYVEKERFAPLRLLTRQGEAMQEIRMLDYSSPLLGEWHPRVVEIRRGDDLLRFVADQVESNAKLPENLF
ncbi:MAG: hypothetical protein HY901_33135 [Deltaproteobacteria bacterium]|nr:hypothetical protein [Deltaproteobacteria bacterium]